jgi:hypothetical protein
MKKLNILQVTHIVPREVAWYCGLIEKLHTIETRLPSDGSRNIVLIRVYP